MVTLLQAPSYAVRNARMSVKQRAVLESDIDKHAIDLGSDVNFEHIFARKAAIVVEIGFGDGASLLEMAAKYRDTNFIGIEVYKKGVVQLIEQIKLQQLTNLKIIYAEALWALGLLPSSSVSRLQVFFPDPWPKKRHHKRRIINNDFIKVAQQKLQLGGILHIATDWQDYAQQIEWLMRQADNFTKIAQPEYIRPATKFETRGIKAGYQIFDLIFQYNAPID